MTCSSKIVVFDLDETLGYFMELGMFWDALKGYIKHEKLKISTDQNLFNDILELYPEFLRPNIIEILNYLKKKKEKNHCDKLMIYTNNQGPTEWAKYIMHYFEKKINYKIFDQIIAAFKIQGKRVEVCRTTHMKTHTDLIKCSKIPENTQICFLDDVFYPDMSNDKIYYINVKPYTYDLSFDDMISRCINSGILGPNIDTESCITYISTFMKRYNYIFMEKNSSSHNLDKIISKKILNHLHVFFKIKNDNNNHRSNNRSNLHKSKRNRVFHNKTLKKRNN
jgi:hypothetical protein